MTLSKASQNYHIIALLFLATSVIGPSLSAHAADFNVSDDRQSTSIKEDAASSAAEESKSAQAAQSSASTSAPQKNSYQIGSVSGVYGGSLSTSFRWYRDLDNEDTLPDFLRWSLQEKASLSTSFKIDGVPGVSDDGVRGYVRGGMSNVDRGTGPTYTGIGADVAGPYLDLAYFGFDLVKTDNFHKVRLTSGRQFLFVGRGLAYSATSDGFRVEITDPALAQKYFVARSLPREDNIDFSVPGFDKEGARFFYGAEWEYHAIPRLSLYGYTFGQSDQSAENPDDIRQNYHYDSFYYGGGFVSKPNENWQFWGELVGESGTGHTDAQRSKLQETTVDAWAWILGGKYQFLMPTHPTVETEGAYGSGDPDRVLVTNTVNGSTDSRDTNFLYFGYYAAGYAFQPRLSNLYVYSAGLSLQPLEQHPAFRRFAIGGKGYIYFKDERDGGTSDVESAGRDSDLGSEFDLYTHWQVFPNLLWSVRYGVFIPSRGFLADQQDPTQFLYSRLSWDF